MKPRIGIDARFFGIEHAGLGRYTNRLIEALDRLTHQFEILIFIREKLPNHLTTIETEIANFPHYSIAEQLFFPHFLKKARLDLVHFLSFNHPILWREPFVVTIHDLTLERFPGPRGGPIQQAGWRAVMADAVRRASRIIAVSKFVRDDLLTHYKIPKERVVVVAEGVDPPRLLPKEQQAAILRKLGIHPPYLLTVGQIRVHKNLPRLIAAFSQLARRFPTLSLVIAGREDPDYPDVREAIERSDSKGRIRLTGFVRDEALSALYQGATAFVLPSLSEGFGLPLLEAMTYGLPIAAARSTSLPELGGNACLYFDPLSEAEMVAVIEALLTNPTLARRLASRGRRRARHFDWRTTAAATLKVWRDVLE